MIDSIRLLEEEKKSPSTVLDTDKAIPKCDVSQVINCDLTNNKYF